LGGQPHPDLVCALRDRVRHDTVDPDRRKKQCQQEVLVLGCLLAVLAGATAGIEKQPDRRRDRFLVKFGQVLILPVKNMLQLPE
jgi:hypothetical protein